MKKGVKLLTLLLGALTFTSLLFSGGQLGGVDPNPYVQVPVIDGDTLHIFIGTTDYIVKEALRGAAGTGRMIKDNLVVLYAPIQDSIAFVCFDARNTTFICDISKITGGGQLVGCNTFDCFVKWMADNGWKSIPAKGMAEAVWQRILIIAGKAEVPVFLFTMGGSFEIAPTIIAEQYPQDDA